MPSRSVRPLGHARPVIVVDGRTDEEKLRELLAAGAEETALDFKATLDLSDKSSKDVLALVKDCVAMGNLPNGGYIVVGVDDTGAPAIDQPPIDITRFDSADLRAKIARYTEAAVHVISQRHTLQERDVVLLYISPSPDGLPVPFSHIGQYPSGKEMKTVFRPGEVVVREGTSNVQLRYAHWHQLLGTYRDRIRHEARGDANSLIAQIVSALGAGSGGSPGTALPTTPLVVGMDWETFDEALVTHLEATSTVRVERFLRATVEGVSSAFPVAQGPGSEPNSAYEDGLDAIAVIAINTVEHHRDDIYKSAVRALSDTYEAGGRAPTRDVGNIGSEVRSAGHWLQVAQRVLAIGRAVVASKRFDLLPQLVHRRVEMAQDYAYETWIRHAYVGASRSGLLPTNEGAPLLSATRLLLGQRPWLRPDLMSTAEYQPGAPISDQDTLLNQLVQLDVWAGVIATLAQTSRPGLAYFPSCGAFHQYRAQPAIDTISSDETARRGAFPDDTDSSIAHALARVLKAALHQSLMYGGWWEGVEDDSSVATFLTSHGVDIGSQGG